MKAKRTSRILAILLIMAVMLSALTTPVFASDFLTGYGASVGSIEITGASVQSGTAPTVTTFTYSGYNCYRYTYNIVLSGATSPSATVTANFTKDGGASPYCRISPVPPNQPPALIDAYARLDYAATLSGGSGTVTAYVHHDLAAQRGNCDIYIFNYTVSGINNPITVGSGGDITLRFGDPVYPNTTPESLMSFEYVSGDTYDAEYTGDDSDDFYPNVLTLLATPDTQINRLVGSGVQIATYDTLGNKTSHPSIIPADNINNGIRSDIYTVEIGTLGGTLTVYEEDGITVAAVISFAAPKSVPAGGGTPPDTVNGYLPVGQFATGSGWGSLYTDGTNLTGNTLKFKGGYTATGTSLGMLGGYVQFDMGTTPITNDADNPYGVDFIIYGNAFNGNPEAGSVQVSEDGISWYELAGSRYYDSGTTRNLNVTYINMTAADTGLNAAFTSAGVYASRNYTGSNMSTATWVRMGANAWWPEYSSEGYSRVDDFTGVVKTTPNTAYVNWDRSGTYEMITYKNVTEVPDSDTNGFYQFGYFDVTPNGTSYGNAANPYETYVSTKSGGDGFDISWAVDANGQPVILSSVRYIRAYSSVLYNAGIFGETSAEVCALYVANGTGSGAAAVPTAISVTSSSGTTNNRVTTYMGTTTVNLIGASTAYIKVTDPGTYIYVNGTLVTSGAETAISLTSTYTNVQVIIQDGTESPYVTLLRIRK